ncbi:DNA helicase PIF1, ATP-dependent [Tanacetum coccineum]
MASKSIASRAEIETKQDIGEVESKQVMSAKGSSQRRFKCLLGIEAKQTCFHCCSTKAPLILGSDTSGFHWTVVVMIGRIGGDVNVVTSSYLRTDFVVSDAKGNAIHCTARSNVTHNFLLLKEGVVALSLQLVDFDGIEPTDNKNLIDVVGYITNVGRTNHQKTKQAPSIRATLWGALGDVLVEKKSKQAGMCPIVLTSANAKYYNDKLYLSSSSSTLIFDDADIPAVKALMTNMPVSVRIANVRTRKGWNFPSCGGENFLRYRLELDVADDTANAVVVMFDEPATTLVGCSAESVMEDDDESSDDQSNPPPALANLIGTTHTLEIKSHNYYEFGTFESFTCWTIVPTEGVAESASSSTLDAAAATESPKLKSLTWDPSVPTPSKPDVE